MNGISAGIREIRIRSGGAWRVLYVAKFTDAVYVLHAFGKKTPSTVQTDIELAAKRCAEVAKR
jgi:phage-related protein